MDDDSIIRVVVVDDHAMFLESVVRLLHADSRIDVVGTALTAAEGAAVAAAELPDVVILDYDLPDMDAGGSIRAIKSALPDGKIVTLTGSERPGALFTVMRAGSSAWIRKTRTVSELIEAVHHVAAGRPVASEELESLPTLEQLVLHYQPIVELITARVVGFEGLVRWQHPELGLLHPGSFLPLAEETGFVGEIDRWAREEATSQLVEWQGGFEASPRLWMAVNLSASDLADPGLFDSMAATVNHAGIDPADLVVEVTESVLLDDTEETMEFLNRLKQLGVGLALDDFGTAFSSLSYIRRFPFDHLKIDISFTAELPHSARSMLLVEAIHNMAWSIGMTSIAEGIEREEQAVALRGIGWELGQGYLYSEPLPADECAALLRAQRLSSEPARAPSLPR